MTDATWTIEVDVIIARPPTPENTRTATVQIAHPAETHDDEWDAHLTAIYMVWGSKNCDHSDMPVASRTVLVEI